MHAGWQDTALSGEGAALYPGRWNSAGERVVYLADSLALAVLETLVHLEAPATEEPCVAIELYLPEAKVEKVGQLQEGWQTDLNHTRTVASAWLRSGRSLALEVPSAIVPAGTDIILNPAHEAAVGVKELRRVSLRWDRRLFQR